jgi:hypothetical protein
MIIALTLYYCSAGICDKRWVRLGRLGKHDLPTVSEVSGAPRQQHAKERRWPQVGCQRSADAEIKGYPDHSQLTDTSKPPSSGD